MLVSCIDHLIHIFEVCVSVTDSLQKIKCVCVCDTLQVRYYSNVNPSRRSAVTFWHKPQRITVLERSHLAGA